MSAEADRTFGLAPAPLTGVAVLMAAGLGWIDHATGPEISFSIFYLAPVAVVAWNVPDLLRPLLLCLLTAGIWLWADLTAGHVYSHAAIPIWNAGVRLGFFVIVARLLHALRASLRAQEEAATTDGLTGLANRRRFYESVDAEAARLRRHGRPFTLVYIDLDGFKEVNDRGGHDEGDRVLVEVARALSGATRATDVVARLGGDEFALLLPECDEERAREVVPEVRRRCLAALAALPWTVDLSAGAVVAGDAGVPAAELVRAADAVMYEVKRGGKGAVAIAPGPTAASPPPA